MFYLFFPAPHTLIRHRKFSQYRDIILFTSVTLAVIGITVENQWLFTNEDHSYIGHTHDGIWHENQECKYEATTMQLLKIYILRKSKL